MSTYGWLKHTGLLNEDTTHIGELEGEPKLKWVAYCSSYRCCETLGHKTVTVNGQKITKIITRHKDRIIKQDLKLHQDNCPDCGHILKWIRRETL